MEEAHKVVSKLYAQQIMEKTIRDAVLNSKNPPENSSLANVNIFFSN